MFPGSFREKRNLETVITPRGISYATGHGCRGLSCFTMSCTTTAPNVSSVHCSWGDLFLLTSRRRCARFCTRASRFLASRRTGDSRCLPTHLHPINSESKQSPLSSSGAGWPQAERVPLEECSSSAAARSGWPSLVELVHAELEFRLKLGELVALSAAGGLAGVYFVPPFGTHRTGGRQMHAEDKLLEDERVRRQRGGRNRAARAGGSAPAGTSTWLSGSVWPLGSARTGSRTARARRSTRSPRAEPLRPEPVGPTAVSAARALRPRSPPGCARLVATGPRRRPRADLWHPARPVPLFKCSPLAPRAERSPRNSSQKFLLASPSAR